jgi:hypothetical protein
LLFFAAATSRKEKKSLFRSALNHSQVPLLRERVIVSRTFGHLLAAAVLSSPELLACSSFASRRASDTAASHSKHFLRSSAGRSGLNAPSSCTHQGRNLFLRYILRTPCAHPIQTTLRFEEGYSSELCSNGTKLVVTRRGRTWRSAPGAMAASSLPVWRPGRHLSGELGSDRTGL